MEREEIGSQEPESEETNSWEQKQTGIEQESPALEEQSLEEISGNEESPVESKDSYTSAPEVPVITEKIQEKKSQPDAKYTSLPLPQNKMPSEAFAVENAYAQGASPINAQTAYAFKTDDIAVYSTTELRKLVVWSEVLGKPVGLRDIE